MQINFSNPFFTLFSSLFNGGGTSAIPAGSQQTESESVVDNPVVNSMVESSNSNPACKFSFLSEVTDEQAVEQRVAKQWNDRYAGFVIIDSKIEKQVSWRTVTINTYLMQKSNSIDFRFYIVEKKVDDLLNIVLEERHADGRNLIITLQNNQMIDSQDFLGEIKLKLINKDPELFQNVTLEIKPVVWDELTYVMSFTPISLKMFDMIKEELIQHSAVNCCRLNFFDRG